MMVLLPYVHDDDDEDNGGNDNDDDDGFLHKKKKQIAHLSIHKFRRISHNLRQVFVPIFLGLCPSLAQSFKCLLITFPAFCDITWAFFNKLLII